MYTNSLGYRLEPWVAFKAIQSQAAAVTQQRRSLVNWNSTINQRHQLIMELYNFRCQQHQLWLAGNARNLQTTQNPKYRFLGVSLDHTLNVLIWTYGKTGCQSPTIFLKQQRQNKARRTETNVFPCTSNYFAQRKNALIRICSIFWNRRASLLSSFLMDAFKNATRTAVVFVTHLGISLY